MTEPITLYIKTGCPWCISAQAQLNALGFRYREIDVRKDRVAFDEMRRISGQTYAPTLVVSDKVLADFGPEELAQFLKQNDIRP